LPTVLGDVHFVSPIDVGLEVPAVTCVEYTPFNFFGINETDVKDAKDILWFVSKIASLLP
jgi:hypothetical protein